MQHVNFLRAISPLPLGMLSHATYMIAPILVTEKQTVMIIFKLIRMVRMCVCVNVQSHLHHACESIIRREKIRSFYKSR